MNKFKILIIEDDETACNAFREIIKTDEDLSLINCVSDAEVAIDIMKTNSPDALILDLELHNGAGKGTDVLNALKFLPYKPFIVVTTHNPSAITHGIVRRKGADFIICKHERDYSAKKVLGIIYEARDFLYDMSETNHTEDISKVKNDYYISKVNSLICEELNFVHTPSSMTGYQYLQRGIFLLIDGVDSKNVIKTVAKEFNATTISVNRAMQRAIDKTLYKSDIFTTAKEHTALCNQAGEPSTPKEFICSIANKIRNRL